MIDEGPLVDVVYFVYCSADIPIGSLTAQRVLCRSDGCRDILDGSHEVAVGTTTIPTGHPHLHFVSITAHNHKTTASSKLHVPRRVAGHWPLTAEDILMCRSADDIQL